MTTTTRYVIEKDIMESPCDHPMCDQLHKRFMQRGWNDTMYHETKTVWWVVIDTTTQMQVHNASTKRECTDHVEYLISRNVSRETSCGTL